MRSQQNLGFGKMGCKRGAGALGPVRGELFGYHLGTEEDFSNIKHMIISCHDFRANSRHGEFYRTKDKVLAILNKNKFDVKFFDYNED